MNIEQNQIEKHNDSLLTSHQRKLNFLKEDWSHVDLESVIQKLVDFQIAIPSWALGTGGTRFGRFAITGGEPRTIEEKIEDVGLLHALNGASGAISLHIPWDIPQNAESLKSLALSYGLKFDAMNSNTFQDQAGSAHSYK
ncbi:MAG: sugar isomerase, partial [Sphingobacteriales bacterium]